MRGEDTNRSGTPALVNGNTSTCVEKTFLHHNYLQNLMETPPHAWRRQTYISYFQLSKQKHLHMRGEDFTTLRRVGIMRETPPHAWRRLYDLRIYLQQSKKHLHMRGEDYNRGEIFQWSHRNTSTCVEKTFLFEKT